MATNKASSSIKAQLDYVARIRYQNELPPPPCPPKLIKIPVDMVKYTKSTFLSDSLQKRKINMDIDVDLGMPLDLTEVPGYFYDGDESGIYAESTKTKLEPEDRALMREPSNKKSTVSGGVAFLRRTEYGTADLSRHQNELKAAALAKQAKEVVIDPEEILKKVDATFDKSNEPLISLKHPKKKGIKAIKSWALLPDTKMFDLTYVTVRMVGSASLSTHKRNFSEAELSTALFKQSAIENDEWMSYYVAEDDEAQALRNRVLSNEDTIEEDSTAYRFTRIQDNDVTLENKRPEIIMSFDRENGSAYYTNVAGQANLKRRRVVKHRRDLVNESNIAQIDLSLREITTTESNARDESRAEYDPVSYGVSDDVR